VVLCAGWKDRFNLEDTLFAGAVVEELLGSQRFGTDCDSARAARLLYLQARHDLFGFLQESSHRERLGRLHLEDDIRYCLTPNQTTVVPKLFEGKFLSL
jgi:2-phosphosulfolactate phosphatase